MSIIDGFFVALLGVFFLILMVYTLGDLARDLGYYRKKHRNVVPLKKRQKGIRDEIKPKINRN